MVTTLDVSLDDGRTVRVHDTARESRGELVLVWHHGSPQTGALLEPLVAASAARGIRLLSYGRPSYGGSMPNPDRDVASAAADVVQIADALGIERFATMGASGGGPHALACAAMLPDRICAVVTLAGIAPFSDEYDWFAGMAAPEGLQAAFGGREARAAFALIEEFNPDSFVPADYAALDGSWASLNDDVQASAEWGDDGLIDDDVALASPWGFDLTQIVAPTLLVQGGRDRIVPPEHAARMLRSLARGELWSRPTDGHISVLDAAPVALDWIRANAEPN